MTASFRSQLVKLKRPGWLALIFGLCLGFVTLSVLTQFLNEGPDTIANAGVETLALQDGAVRGVTEISGLLGMVILVVFARAFTVEFSLGTLRNLLVRQPRRLTFLAGTLAALLAFTLLVAAASTLASIALSFVFAGGHVSSTEAWTSAAGWQADARAFVNVALSMMALGLFGAAIGILLRSSTTAIALGLVYLLIVEPLLGALLPGSGDWSFGAATTAIGQHGSDAMSYGHGFIVTGVYLLVLLGAAAWLFRSRDVSS